MGKIEYMSVDMKCFQRFYEGMTGKEVLQAKARTLRAGSYVIIREARKRLKSTSFNISSTFLKRIAYYLNKKKYMSTIHLFGNMPAGTPRDKRAVALYMEEGAEWRNGGPKRGNKEQPPRKRNRPRKKWRIEGRKYLSTATTVKKAQTEEKMNETMQREINKIYLRYRDIN